MDRSQSPTHIFGWHDPGGESFFDDAGKKGWIVHSVRAAEGGGDFRGESDAGHGVIVRLNHGYGSDGTIPRADQYDAFAQACAQYVASSQGAQIWIIGNETNLSVERPGNGDGQEGELITPARYALCYSKCRAAIKALPGHADDWVIPSPPGPWNVETRYAGNEAGDWVIYFRGILDQCLRLGATPDAIAIHTYTHDATGEHGMNTDFIASEDKFAQAPYTERHYQFRAYRDFMNVIPSALRDVPVLITESQGLPWEDRDIGWVQNAYAEINAWNAVPSNQPIQTLCLFRWQANRGDPPGWGISNRRHLLDDVRAAFQNDFRVRWVDGAVARPVPAKPKPTPVTPRGDILPLDKARWNIEEAIRKLEAGDGAGARQILVVVVVPWFYASAADHSDNLPQAQAQTAARWHCEDAVRRIEAGQLDEARETLLTNVLSWVQSPGPSQLGILGEEEEAPKPKRRGRKKKSTPVRSEGERGRLGVLGDDAAPEEPALPVLEVGVVAAPAQDRRETLLHSADARQVLQFNTNAALQKRMFSDGLVPNSAEFQITLRNQSYVAQRAEHLLTGEVRVYYAPTTDFSAVRYVVRGGSAGFNTPFQGGNRITQAFAARPEYYSQFKLIGHEGLDLVPRDQDREIFAIEGGVVIKKIDLPGDPKVNAYGIYVVVYNRDTQRTWYYCHMTENHVQRDQTIQRGDKVGRMGGTGNTQGDHLHLGMRPVDKVGLPAEPKNGFKGFADPQPIMDALNSADTQTELRDALFTKAETSQVIAFNTQAALQKQIFADAYCPNSPEFGININGTEYVAQRAEELKGGAVRVYYAPTTNFGDIQFVVK